MKIHASLFRWAGIGAFALGLSPAVFAQAGSFGGGFGPPLQVVKPPREFATSEEHYAYLLAQAKGGTKHTLATVPRWDGLWQPGGWQPPRRSYLTWPSSVCSRQRSLKASSYAGVRTPSRTLP